MSNPKGNPTHGMSGTRTYSVWAGMIQRCNNPKTEKYADYGGRGIKLHEPWLKFETFFADMGACPGPSYTLDRYPDNNGNYEPKNCQWRLHRDNCRNKRNNHFIQFDGQTFTVEEWAEKIGMNARTLRSRLRLGWSDDEVLLTPLMRQGGNIAPKRRHLNLTTKLAAVLLQLGHISYEESKVMTAFQICSLYDFDHYPILKADGGPDEPWNLTPRLISEHREKTAKIDVPAIAKGRRIRKKQTAHKERIDLKGINEELNALDWHPPLKRYRGIGTIRSKGFDKTKTRGFDGRVRPRKSLDTREGKR